MKKTLKINLSGIVFTIDEDAYEKLKKYLDTIGRYFSNKEESKEIINDIEARIAELFREKKPKETDVVNIELVNEVIEIMGQPEDYAEAVDGQETYSEGSGRTRGRSRRLYRDPENSVISGVCGGLGAYFNMDPLIFRLIFVVLFFLGGASILVYIILWIALPRAETAAQKLEMRGDPVNVSNIEKKVREEYESTRENIKKTVRSKRVKKNESSASYFFSELGKIILVFIKVILIIIGTALVLSGIGIIIALITGTFVGINFLPFGSYDFTLSDILSPFSDPVSITLLIISVTLLFLIPVIAMIYGLIRLIFGIRSRNRGLAIGTTTLWFVALLMTAGIIAIESSNYSKSGTDITKSTLNVASDTLYIGVNELQVKNLETYSWIDFDFDEEMMFSEEMDRIYGKADLDIEKASGEEWYIEIEKHSKGKNWDEADENAAQVNYSFSMHTNHLTLDPYFNIETDEKWRFPYTEITIYLPEGKLIVLDKETRKMLSNVYNVDHVSDWSMAGKTWIMTGDGLKLMD